MTKIKQTAIVKPAFTAEINARMGSFGILFRLK